MEFQGIRMYRSIGVVLTVSSSPLSRHMLRLHRFPMCPMRSGLAACSRRRQPEPASPMIRRLRSGLLFRSRKVAWQCLSSMLFLWEYIGSRVIPVRLVRVQWRSGDPIDLYVIRPTGSVKPPVNSLSLRLSLR